MIDSEHHIQAEMDIDKLETVIADLFTDWGTPSGHRVMISDNRIIAAADDLALLVEKLKRAATTRTDRIRRVG